MCGLCSSMYMSRSPGDVTLVSYPDNSHDQLWALRMPLSNTFAIEATATGLYLLLIKKKNPDCAA